VLRDETLTGLFFDLEHQGYESEIRYQICKITFINMSIGSIELMIKTQSLTTISIERSLIIHDEIVYNSMARGFTKIHEAASKL